MRSWSRRLIRAENEMSKEYGFVNCQTRRQAAAILHQQTNVMSMTSFMTQVSTKLINCKIMVKAINIMKPKRCASQLVRERSHAGDTHTNLGKAGRNNFDTERDVRRKRRPNSQRWRSPSSNSWTSSQWRWHE